MGNLDANFNGSIFRKDWYAIIASDRHLAKIMGIRAAYNANPILPGTVMAQKVSDTFYYPYSQAASGTASLGVAVGVTLDFLDFSAATGAGPSGYGTLAARLLIGGAPIYYSKLVGIDANGLTNMGARVVTNAYGDQLMIW